MKNFCHFLILALASSAICCNAQQTGHVHADLKAEVTVDARVVTLGDIASLSGDNQGVLNTLRQVQLAIAPQPDYTLHLTQREVQHLLHEAGSQEVIVAGADSTTVTIKATLFNPERLVATAKEQLAAALTHDGQVVEIIQSEDLPSIRVPRGEVSLRARPQTSDRPRSHMTEWIDILLDGSFYRAVPVSFTVTAMQQVMVARTNLSKGQTLSCANVDRLQRDIAQLASAPQADDCANPGRRMRRNLQAGEVILSSELEAVPAVSEGDYVTLQVTEGAVALESRALALTDGQVGQRISVRATSSQEPVLGLVVAPGVVTVSGR